LPHPKQEDGQVGLAGGVDSASWGFDVGGCLGETLGIACRTSTPKPAAFKDISFIHPFLLRIDDFDEFQSIFLQD
jgi:hypothetical protein